MSERVEIRTGCRLHFGILSYEPEKGRHFGGVGAMLTAPGVEIVAARAQRDEVLAAASDRERVVRIVSTYRRHCPEELRPPPCRLEARGVIPRHVGLGSGTQLALAVAKGLASLAGEDCSAVELARRVGRGRRSALGIHGFERGGLLVEAGKRSPEEIGPLVARTVFPAEWRFVLFTPSGRGGLSGPAERDAFAQLAPMPRRTTERLSRLVLLELLPAVADADCRACSEALYEFGHTVGEYFAPVQGGVFAHPHARELAGRLRALGVTGVGQSSWGPTLFALVPDADRAAHLVEKIRGEAACGDLRMTVSELLSRGAEVSVV